MFSCGFEYRNIKLSNFYAQGVVSLITAEDKELSVLQEFASLGTGVLQEELLYGCRVVRCSSVEFEGNDAVFLRDVRHGTGSEGRIGPYAR